MDASLFILTRKCEEDNIRAYFAPCETKNILARCKDMIVETEDDAATACTAFTKRFGGQ
jgi:hypothetical protein